LDKAENTLSTAETAEPNNLDAKVLRAALFVRHNNNERGRDIVNEVLNTNPTHRDALAMLAGMHSDAGRDDEAQATLDRALETYPDNATFLTLQSRLYLKRGQADLAWDTYEKIAQLEPDNFTKTTEIVKIMLQNQQRERALGLLDKFISNNPENTDAKVAKVELLQLFGRKDDALALLDTYIKQNPKEFIFGLTKASYALQAGQRSQGIEQLTLISRDAAGTPSELRALNILARVYLEDKQLEQAKAAVDTVLSKSAKDLDALEVRGILALNRKDFTQAIGDFRAVIADKPTQTKIYQALANAHTANGEAELALTVLRDGVKANPTNITLHIELANQLKRANDIKGAESHFEEAVKLDSHNAKALDGLVNIYLEQKKGAAIRTYSEPLQADTELGLLTRYYTALSYSVDDKPQKALELFDALLKEKADFIEVVSARAKTMLQMGQNAAARNWLRQQLPNLPKDQAVIYNLMGELALNDKEYSQAIENFQQAIKLQDTWAIPYSHLANAQRKANNTAAAIATLQAGLGKQPNHLLLLNDLASLYEADKQPDKAIQLYDTFYKNNGQPEIIGNNLAMLLATYRTDSQSNQLALSIADQLRSSKNPLYLDTAGWVYFKQGRIIDAKTILLDAQSKFDTPVIHYHLGAVYLAEKDKTSAKYHLEKAQTDKSNYPGRSEVDSLLNTLAQE
ncbi:MAG TPA: tetratricopeptide repeat protein, partial [Cellvibrionaceae bacterium]|nr:tetratricopeptide repeat protein [Cellvibrionaceae bacterium]